MIVQPPISTITDTVGPYTTVGRSRQGKPAVGGVGVAAGETGESIAGEGMDGKRRVPRPSRPSWLCVRMCRDHWASVPARPTIRFAAPARMGAQHLRAGRGNRLARPSFAAGPCPTLTSEPRLL